MGVYGDISFANPVNMKQMIEVNQKFAPYYKLEGKTTILTTGFNLYFYCTVCVCHREIYCSPEVVLYNRAPVCGSCGKLSPFLITEFASVQAEWQRPKTEPKSVVPYRRIIHQSLRKYLDVFYTNGYGERAREIYQPRNSVKLYLEFPKKAKIGRTDFLRSIDGWYTSEKSSLDKLVEKSGLGDVSKYLRKTVPGIDEKMVKEVVDNNTGIKFKLSTQYRDILRCSKTKHFDSCLNPNGCNKDAPRLYLRCKEVAVIFVPDSKGDFLARVFAVANGKQLILLRKYGNANWEKLLETLRKNKIEAKWSTNADYAYLTKVFRVAYFDAGIA